MWKDDLAIGEKKLVRVDWVCTKCGLKETRGDNQGRPTPRVCLKNNKGPHVWVEEGRRVETIKFG